MYLNKSLNNYYLLNLILWRLKMEDLKNFYRRKMDNKIHKHISVIDPSNEKIFAEIILGNDKDEAAVYAAKKAFNIFPVFQRVIDWCY